MIATGYDADLDELRHIATNTDGFLLELEARERERTGIPQLKLGYNRVQGFFIEIGRAQADRVPADYLRRQTVKNAERFITPELKGFEDKVLGAREKSLAREKELYEALLQQLVDRLGALQDTAGALSTVDATATLAERATTLRWNEPTLVVTSRCCRSLRAATRWSSASARRRSCPNDLALDARTRMLVITGPNMGGKSTYMRQAALIAILAHIGSFVPAAQATLGPLDRIFTRIGAGDDLAGGRSTFMVEMTETANILHNATERSLILMDEIGRGTSTFDGLSLAWATARHIATKLRAFTLFATHYFELTSLADESRGIANVHLDAAEHRDGIVFLHAVQPGPASRSYGLAVAQLAGVPREVIGDARRYLAELEAQAARHAAAAAGPQGELAFDPPAPPAVPEVDERAARVQARLLDAGPGRADAAGRRCRWSTSCGSCTGTDARASSGPPRLKRPSRRKRPHSSATRAGQHHAEVADRQHQLVGGAFDAGLAHGDGAVVRLAGTRRTAGPARRGGVPAITPSGRSTFQRRCDSSQQFLHGQPADHPAAEAEAFEAARGLAAAQRRAEEHDPAGRRRRGSARRSGNR